MARDELLQPLRRRGLGERLWAKRPSALMLASAVSFLGMTGGAIWLTSLAAPLAGEPVVTLLIPPVSELETASTEPVEETAPPVDEEAIAAEAPDEETASDPGSEAYQQEATIIVSPRRPLKPAPFSHVAETSASGPLPRVSEGGKKPSDLYAQTTPMAVLHSGRPKIALLLGGMGLNARLTQKAVKGLPGNVTFGFAPYGEDLQAQVNRARAEGHEVMLQLPMEPLGYPGNNPGPNTLVSEADEATNQKALHWHMGRFAGYTGITNYMGARFLAEPQSLRPVLAEMKARGLVFLEDGNVPASAAASLAEMTGVPARRAAVVIDAIAEAEAIEAKLKELEEIARREGIAIGTGAGLDLTIETVAEWARRLESRGFLLVPVSAAYRGRPS